MHALAVPPFHSIKLSVTPRFLVVKLIGKKKLILDRTFQLTNRATLGTWAHHPIEINVN